MPLNREAGKVSEFPATGPAAVRPKVILVSSAATGFEECTLPNSSEGDPSEGRSEESSSAVADLAADQSVVDEQVSTRYEATLEVRPEPANELLMEAVPKGRALEDLGAQAGPSDDMVEIGSSEHEGSRVGDSSFKDRASPEAGPSNFGL